MLFRPCPSSEPLREIKLEPLIRDYESDMFPQPGFCDSCCQMIYSIKRTFSFCC